MTSFSEFLASLGGADRSQRPARFGVIDIGSNSVRLVVFDSATRTPAVFFNEKILCGLGETLEQTGRLSERGRERAFEALRRFQALTERMDLRAVAAVGTAALREAEDGQEFVADVAARLGVSVWVAEGADEARLAAQGVLLGDPLANGVVADMGGASLELTTLTPAGAGAGGVTTALGPLRVMAWGGLSNGKRDARIDAALEAALTPALRRPPALYALGGSWRTVVRCQMERVNYPLRVLHGFSMPLSEAAAAAEWVAGLAPEAVHEMTGVSERRAAVTPMAARVLLRLLKAVKPERLVLSAFGLREGVLWEHLPAALRERDPLLDAAEALERSHARMPGFGAELWAWLRGPMAPFEPREARLAEAGCLIADASWRTHPDYRARSSFELVTRNALGGLDHEDRLYIGAALLHRYKGGKRALRAEPSMAYLSEEKAMRAEALGRGVRLGVVIAGAAPGLLPRCDLIRGAPEPGAEGGTLTLRLPGSAASLWGEEVEKRLHLFADALGLAPRFEIGA
ncbi:MAG: exopolyphosphatase [Pseudomonadota bacterium]